MDVNQATGHHINDIKLDIASPRRNEKLSFPEIITGVEIKANFRPFINNFFILTPETNHSDFEILLMTANLCITSWNRTGRSSSHWTNRLMQGPWLNIRNFCCEFVRQRSAFKFTTNIFICDK